MEPTLKHKTQLLSNNMENVHYESDNVDEADDYPNGVSPLMDFTDKHLDDQRSAAAI